MQLTSTWRLWVYDIVSNYAKNVRYLCRNMVKQYNDFCFLKEAIWLYSLLLLNKFQLWASNNHYWYNFWSQLISKIVIVHTYAHIWWKQLLTLFSEKCKCFNKFFSRGCNSMTQSLKNIILSYLMSSYAKILFLGWSQIAQMWPHDMLQKMAQSDEKMKISFGTFFGVSWRPLQSENAAG